MHVGGDHFVAQFGKTLHQNQRMLLNQIGDHKPIIFLLDPDAREEMEGIVASFLTGPVVRPVIYPRVSIPVPTTGLRSGILLPPRLPVGVCRCGSLRRFCRGVVLPMAVCGRLEHRRGSDLSVATIHSNVCAI